MSGVIIYGGVSHSQSWWGQITIRNIRLKVFSRFDVYDFIHFLVTSGLKNSCSCAPVCNIFYMKKIGDLMRNVMDSLNFLYISLLYIRISPLPSCNLNHRIKHIKKYNQKKIYHICLSVYTCPTNSTCKIVNKS